MLIPPNEQSLLLAERWLKLLSDLGRAQGTLTAYRSALHHYFSFCSENGIEPEKARFEDLAAYIRLHPPSAAWHALPCGQCHAPAAPVCYPSLV